MRFLRLLILGLFFSPAATLPAFAQEDELARHLETMRRRVSDAAVPIADRERTALEVAATLERASGAAKTPDARRARLDQAADWLKMFNARNPGHPAEREFRRRIAVIHLTEAESWALQADLQPTLTDPPQRAFQQLQQAETELRDILKSSEPASEIAVTHRVKATLARVLATIAERDPSQQESLNEAASLLDEAGDDRTVEDELLRIDLLRRLGRLDEAERLLKEVGQRPDSPATLVMLPVKVRLATARRRFDEALESLRDSGRPIGETAPLAVEVRLAQRDSLEPGADRRNAEREAFEQLRALQDADPLRYRLALFQLVGDVKEPAAGLPSRYWGILAEGHFLRGEAEEAARLWSVGAARAESDRHAGLAWGFRYRAAAAWFDAGEYSKAASLWNRVAQSSQAAALRPRAGLLRATALQRIWHDDPTPAHREQYFAALHDQVRRFPNDPTAGQARYALGIAFQEAGEDSEAIEAFRQVPAGHARRLDALRAVALILRRRLEANAAIADPARLRQEERRAEQQLEAARAEFDDPAAKAELDLDLVRLQLIPNLPTLTPARASLDRLRAGPLREETRKRADVLQISRLVREGAFPEAEKLARTAIGPASHAELEDLAEFLDALAANTTSDVTSRRCGGILDQVVEELLRRPAGTDAPQFQERLKLWKVRSLLFRADPVAARRAVDTIPETATPANRALRADTWLRLDEFPRAEAEFRQLGRDVASGSLPWFAARHGLAVALTKQDKTAEARRLIDGTALLDPELGSPRLKQRFEALRKRLPSP